MKISDIDNSNIQKILKISDLENFFDVYVDKKGNYIYNLNETLYINASEDSLLKYRCNSDLQWSLISYNIYGTTRLAWLLMKLNNVKASEVFDCKKAGDVIYYLDENRLEGLLADINEFN